MIYFWASVAFMISWLYFTKEFVLTFFKNGNIEYLFICFVIGMFSFLIFVYLHILDIEQTKKPKD